MIREIERIYETYSIYKSIFICKDETINELYYMLIKRNFPVSKTCDLKNFNDNLSRILLIDEIDANYFNILCSFLNLKNVNFVIYCDRSFSKLNDLPPFINHIFI
jgi:hypothetical protein